MKVAPVSRWLHAGIYRLVRVVVRLVPVLVLFLIAALVFLRIYGVPDPLLRELVRRVNAAGIPLDVASVNFSLHGWHAENLRYYSHHPDDLSPLFQSDEVFLSIRSDTSADSVSRVWKVDVEAVGINLNPSVAWRIGIPTNSPCRRVDRMDVSMEFLPDRIKVTRGEMVWLGSRINVSGLVHTGPKKARGASHPSAASKRTAPSEPKPVQPELVTEQQFQSLELQLKHLSMPSGARVDIEFAIDTKNPTSNRIDVSAQAEEVAFRGIAFSKAECRGSFVYPFIHLQRMVLWQDQQLVTLSGEYDLVSKEAKGSLTNLIITNQILSLLSAPMQAVMLKSEIKIEALPQLKIDFGPAPVKDLLNHVSGTFSIRNFAYMGVEFEAVDGRVARTNNRLEFTNLQASVRGQESRAVEVGSSMQGGSGTGEVFWDGNTREFGVKVDASLDPNLLVRALAPIRIATNIIQRFRFLDLPPKGHLELGANVTDSSTFFIDIQAVATDVVFQDVEFTSVNVTEAYKSGTLSLDPVMALQGVDFIKGSTQIDFIRSTVGFDVLSSVNPSALEDIIWPRLNVFGRKIIFGEKVNVVAQGLFDWKTMEHTDFSATVEAGQLTLPGMATDHFKAEVRGSGPSISVTNAVFGMYGGQGQGCFSLQWNPGKRALPYKTDFSFSDVDFRKFIENISTKRIVKVSGRMSGDARVAADMATNFFATAKGDGFVRVDDGQLTDLPLFAGFSSVIRIVFPSFTVFSITSLKGHFSIGNGVISSEDAYFNGDVLSAKGKGFFSQSSGYNAYVQVQLMSASMLSKVVRIITDPLMKIFELRLEGPLSKPSWRLENFSGDTSTPLPDK